MKNLILLLLVSVSIALNAQLSDIECGTWTQQQRTNAINANFDTLDRYDVLAGVLRYNPVTTEWFLITGGGHTYTKGTIDSVTTNRAAGTISVHFTESYDSVISFITGVDETFIAYDFNAATSVGLDVATIYYKFMNNRAGGYIYYNGSSWVTASADVDSVEWIGTELYVYHKYINDISVSAIARDGVYNIQIGSPSFLFTRFKFYDWSGTQITTPDASMKFSFLRQENEPVKPLVTPDQLDTPWIGSANLWFYGIMKKKGNSLP